MRHPHDLWVASSEPSEESLLTGQLGRSKMNPPKHFFFTKVCPVRDPLNPKPYALTGQIGA